jgi:hypothetical protein
LAAIGAPAGSIQLGTEKKAVTLEAVLLVTVTVLCSEALSLEQVPKSKALVSSWIAFAGSCPYNRYEWGQTKISWSYWMCEVPLKNSLFFEDKFQMRDAL